MKIIRLNGRRSRLLQTTLALREKACELSISHEVYNNLASSSGRVIDSILSLTYSTRCGVCALTHTLTTMQQDSHTYNYITKVLGKKDALHSIFRFIS